MNSNLVPDNRLPRQLRALIPASIVGRTTAAIITLALIVGTVFAALAAWHAQDSEEQRLRARLEELLSTVENTLSIACFVKDAALAREVGNGLLSNRVVAGVRIVADSAPLYEQARASDRDAGSEMVAISREIRSPFNAEETVGKVWLYASEVDIQDQAWAYTRFVLLILSLEVVLVAFSVAWVVYNLITRPIKGISDELHRLETRTGVRLRVPPGNEQDEIGRLVGDVNALIAELTGLVETERTLRLEREQSERRLSLIFEKVDAGIFEVDATGRLLTWNPAFVRSLGMPAEPPQLQALIPAAERPRIEALIAQCLNSTRPCETDIELEAAETDMSRWIEISLTPVEGERLQGVLNDITERKHAELAARQLASRDTLTGLLNRRGLDHSLAVLFERRQREPDLQLALLLIDLDFFKQVNDTHGHEAGDIVLRRVAAVLERSVRRTDLVARFGGDEFAVVLVGIDDATRAEAIAANIITGVSEPIDLGNDLQAKIGASIGIALAHSPQETPASLLRRADDAMYAAKQAGRCRLRVAP